MQLLKQFLVAGLAAGVMSGCALFHDKSADVTVRIHEQVSGSLPATHMLTVEIPKTDLKVAVNPFPVLTEKDVQSAEIQNTAGGAAILLRFDPHGVWVLEQATTEGRSHYLVIFLNGRPVAAWLVDQRLTKGQMLIEGDFSDEEAKTAVTGLNEAVKRRASVLSRLLRND